MILSLFSALHDRDYARRLKYWLITSGAAWRSVLSTVLLSILLSSRRKGLFVEKIMQLLSSAIKRINSACALHQIVKRRINYCGRLQAVICMLFLFGKLESDYLPTPTILTVVKRLEAGTHIQYLFSMDPWSFTVPSIKLEDLTTKECQAGSSALRLHGHNRS